VCFDAQLQSIKRRAFSQKDASLPRKTGDEFNRPVSLSNEGYTKSIAIAPVVELSKRRATLGAVVLSLNGGAFHPMLSRVPTPLTSVSCPINIVVVLSF